MIFETSPGRRAGESSSGEGRDGREEWLRWPALSGPWPCPEIWQLDEGIWGKVPGAATDFRWIATGPGLDLRILDQVRLGAEDRPSRCFFWRTLNDGRVVAVHAYPSRAVDAAGRRGFLERRVAVGHLQPGMSRSWAALVLLDAVSEPWTAPPGIDFSASAWSRPDHHLTMAPRSLACRPDRVVDLARQGLDELRRSFHPDELRALYADLLVGRRPTLLKTPRPLGPTAVAALLLPLPAHLADRLSIAGWTPSSRFDPEALASQWQLIAGDLVAGDPVAEQTSGSAGQVPALQEAGSPSSEIADLCAAAIVEGRPGPKLVAHHVTPSTAWLHQLHPFIEDADARWLDPATFPPPPPLDSAAVRTLVAWRRRLENELSEHVDTWQWTVKLDLLVAFLVAGAPGAPEARATPFLSGRVPALLWVHQLDGDSERLWKDTCPPENREQWTYQSRSVPIAPRHMRWQRTPSGGAEP